jgi:hypothetical protein
LRLAFKDVPPTHELRLTIIGVVSIRRLSRALSAFLRRLKRCLRFAYFRVIEFHLGQPHAHLLVRTDGELTEGQVRVLWRGAVPGRCADAHCAPIRDTARIARYVVKAIRDEHKKELPPEEFRGRLISYSRDFLPRSVRLLQAELVAKWFPV